MLSSPNANMLLSQIGRCLYLKLTARTCAGFVSCRASCLSPSRYGELRQENKTSKMPTTKRKMDRKQKKQPKIIGKQYNQQLGFKRVAGRRTALPRRHTTPFLLKNNRPTRPPRHSPLATNAAIAHLRALIAYPMQGPNRAHIFNKQLKGEPHAIVRSAFCQSRPWPNNSRLT